MIFPLTDFTEVFHRNLLLAGFFCLKKYLEVVGRVFYNQVQEDIFSCLANIFLQTKAVAANNRDLSVVFYSMTVVLCQGMIKIYVSFVDADFLEHMYFFYKKSIDFTAENLHIAKK